MNGTATNRVIGCSLLVQKNYKNFQNEWNAIDHMIGYSLLSRGKKPFVGNSNDKKCIRHSIQSHVWKSHVDDCGHSRSLEVADKISPWCLIGKDLPMPSASGLMI